jgi:hypothetical protein
MKIILTENQIEFIRRYKKIKELIDEGIDVISNEKNSCHYIYDDFIEEVCWQVSDKMEDLNMDTETVNAIDKVHGWVKDNFNTYILEKFEIMINDLKCSGRFYDDEDDDDDEDYISGLMYGVDNIQESIDDKEYFKTLKITLSRRYYIIQQEMDHYMTNNLDCDEYPDDVEGFKDYILEKVTDEMMFTHNINKWEWSDLNDELNNMIGEQIKKTFKSWAKKHC